MVIVMPAFTHSYQCKPDAVSRLVVRFIALRAHFMHDRIDGERCMIQNDRAQEESDKERGEACGRKHVGDAIAIYYSAQCHHNQCQYYRRYQVVLVEPNQLRIFGIVTNHLVISLLKIGTDNPSDV